ncbi:MAG: hypothetical protein IJP54_01925 [Synergistaceae bacterium]|nr:hypothetical protein [Synergistaceae bacterium]MBR0034410.1 hypothetical protein [Synergistaceae bacterium]
MNKLLVKQIQEDYREILQSKAGQRVLGGIFFAGGLNRPVCMMNDFQRGKHDLALQIANTIREASPYGVAEIEISYDEFLRRFNDDGRADRDTGDYAE